MRITGLFAALSVLAALGAPDISAGASLDAAQRRQAVQQLASALRDGYVYPEVGAKAADVVIAKLSDGSYDKIEDPAVFATRLTEDISAIAHDKHMKVVALDAPARGPPSPARIRAEAGVVRADRLAGGVGYIEVRAGLGNLDRGISGVSA